jgi:hypothetical protein
MSMSAEERRKMERLIAEALVFVSADKQAAVLRMAQHLREHKMAKAAWLEDCDNPEPCCALVYLN